MRFQLQPDQVLVPVNNNNNIINQQFHQRSSDSSASLDRLDNELAQSLRFNATTTDTHNSHRIFANELLGSLGLNDNQELLQSDKFGDPNIRPRNEENGNDCFGDFNRTNLIFNEVRISYSFPPLAGLPFRSSFRPICG